MSPYGGAGTAGIDPGRVAEVLVGLGRHGPGRRGSGYRISSSAVLTAAHVVQDAVTVRVRFNADRQDEWSADGTVAWSDAFTDVAVVTVNREEEAALEPVLFGRVSERDAILACSAMGFPRFKLRDDSARPLDDGALSQYRDSHHAVGTIAALSNRREGTLEVTVSPPERDPDYPGVSPWEGMSGAAVWSDGKIIGLIAEHHRSDGLGRLAATRVDRWYEQLALDRLNELRDLCGLPARAHDLQDVVPPTTGELLEAGYTAQVRDIAPNVLLSRDEELAELVQFCAGEDRYQWWQAGPWAGKSALVAWFVLHPPAGVRAVSFFVTGRLPGHADSGAFTEAMIEQLAAVTGEPVSGTANPAGRDGERRRLLDVVARRVGERQQRLLLVVDGLDEDEGARPDSGKPSIASLLPKRPPESVRILVTSRPHPGVPGDVSSDHPLRHCRRRPLHPSPHAQDVKVEAKRELLEHLHGDQLQVDVIGYITAAGGGLTLRELAELTIQSEWTLEGRLGSAFGRSLDTRTSTDRPSDDPADRVYLFAHETLREIAEQQLGRDLGLYRQRIDVWADTYRVQGWGEDTPQCLLRPYGRLLETIGAFDRLVIFATDPARHDRMLAYTYGDAAALTEISAAQQFLRAQSFPDLGALGRLAICRLRLEDRNWAVPAEIAALWARLGQRSRGEALARSITSPYNQAQALAAVAGTLADAREWERAEQLARGIANSSIQVQALNALIESLADAGQWERAEQLIGTITNPDPETQGLGAMVRIMAEINRDRTLDLTEVAEAHAGAISDPSTRAQLLVGLTDVLAEEDREQAIALAAAAEHAAHTIIDPNDRTEALSALMRNRQELWISAPG
jgi:hypothetical protein